MKEKCPDIIDKLSTARFLLDHDACARLPPSAFRMGDHRTQSRWKPSNSPLQRPAQRTPSSELKQEKYMCPDPASLSRRWHLRHRIFWLRRGNKRASSSFLATPQMYLSQSEPVLNRATVDPSSSSGKTRRWGVLSAPALRSYQQGIPALLHGAAGARSPLPVVADPVRCRVSPALDSRRSVWKESRQDRRPIRVHAGRRCCPQFSGVTKLNSRIHVDPDAQRNHWSLETLRDLMHQN